MTTCPVTSLTQVWDPTGVHFDCDTGLPITGRYRPLTTTDLNESSQFGLSISYFASGVHYVPVGAKAWSIGILADGVYVNSVGPLPVGTSLNGGNYDTRAYLGSAITISGASGAYGLVMWES